MRINLHCGVGFWWIRDLELEMHPQRSIQEGQLAPSIPPYNSSEIWTFPGAARDSRQEDLAQHVGFLEMMNGRDLSVEESTITELSGSCGGRKRRGSSVSAASEDECSKLVSTSGGNEMPMGFDGKRCKTAGQRDENKGPKEEIEASSANGSKCAEQSAQSSEAPKQDYIHVRARRGQATDSHSLAERARREKISERMKILQDLVPGCNKVIGKALVLDEIINYIQSLQRQVEFLSLKLEAVDLRMHASPEGFPAKDIIDPLVTKVNVGHLSTDVVLKGTLRSNPFNIFWPFQCSADC
ncbi:hypothetical protein ACLOJK_028532 [Asimina triloba]